MPRDTIHTRDTIDTVVTWGRDTGEVQIATLASDGTERTLKIVNEWLTAAGMQTINVASLNELMPHPPAFDGWYSSLTARTQVNDLIRSLRRARDQAFGADA